MPVQQIIWDPRIGDRYQTQGGQAAYSAANNSAAFTATAAQIAGSGSSQTTSLVILDCTVGTAGGANITLPTVAAVGVQIAEAVGSSWVLRIKNSAGAGTWTVVTNTGWTLNGTMTIATGTYRDFIVTFTSLTTATLQNIGGGATL